jgi:hypothetical protein
VSVRLPLAFLLGVATAALVACGGGSSDKLLSQTRADLIKKDLANIRNAINEQDCQAAEQALQDLNRDLDRTPPSVDRRLRRNLRQGYNKLAQRVPIDCEKPTTTTTETTPTTTETTPTTTETTPTTTETTPTTTETTPTTTTPPETTTTDGSGSGGVTAP